MSTGIKIIAKKAIVEDNDVSGAETGYDIEADEVTAKRNRYTAPLRKLKPLVLAIKKPSANNNEGWKIMLVGAILSLIIGVLLIHYGEWSKEHTQPSLQEQKTKEQTK